MGWLFPTGLGWPEAPRPHYGVQRVAPWWMRLPPATVVDLTGTKRDCPQEAERERRRLMREPSYGALRRLGYTYRAGELSG